MLGLRLRRLIPMGVETFHLESVIEFFFGGERNCFSNKNMNVSKDAPEHEMSKYLMRFY